MAFERDAHDPFYGGFCDNRCRGPDFRLRFIGEVGLAGEVRPAVRTPLRAREAARLGFKKIMISRFEKDPVPGSMDVIRVGDLKDALKVMRR